MIPRCLFLAALAIGAGGCAAFNSAPKAVESQKLTFPHSTHVEAGIPCLECHGTIAQATKVGLEVHLSFPTGAAAKRCLECHDTVPGLPAVSVERSITFSHAAHLPYVNADCARCHLTLSEPGTASLPSPPMSTCTKCHNHAMHYAQAECNLCHIDLKRFPLKPISDFRHVADFLRTHGQIATTKAEACAACHDQTWCAECHAATTRPFKADVQWPERVQAEFIHRGDYVSRHVIDANAFPASCFKCHGSAFCDACHAEQGVSQRTAETGGRNPHPAGWANGFVHGTAARQNIISCAGCHDQGARTTCVTCHATINPHPPDWGQRHNLTSDVAGNSMCRICHLT